MSEWEEAIENLIQNPSQRTNLAENAYQDILRQYNPRVRSLELINTLNQTLQSLNDAPVGKVSLSRSNNAEAIESLSPGILSPELEEHPTLTEMGLYTLRTRGLLTLLKQEWIYFRRYLARFVPYRTAKSIQTNNSNNPGRRGN